MNETPRVLNVATLNSWGLRGDWAARRRILNDVFAAVPAEIVLLQEVIQGATDQAREMLGPDYTLLQSATREEDGQGIAIATMLPVVSVTEVDLHVTSRTRDFACTSLVAELSLDGPAPGVIVVNHFPSWRRDMELERELQAVRTIDAVDEVLDGRDLPVILGGDLDADPDSSSLRFLTGCSPSHDRSVCFVDAWSSVHPGEDGFTYTPDNPLHEDHGWPPRRIDYLLTKFTDGSPWLTTVVDCHRFLDQPVDDIWASDHAGVQAQFVITSKRQAR